MTSRTRPIAVALLALLATACEDQEAEPVSTSVPTALVLLGATIGAVVMVYRWLDRREAGRPAPEASTVPAALRVPAAVAAGLAAAGALAVVALLSWGVAFAYVEPTYQPFSWAETVTVTGIVGAFAVPFALFHVRLARGLWLARPWASTALGCEAGLFAVWSLAAVASA